MEREDWTVGDDGTGPPDHDRIENIWKHLARSDRFADFDPDPVDAPTVLRVWYADGFYPATVEQAYLDVTWYVSGDFTVHYRETYTDGTSWEARWDRHPNSHNTREHYHPGPDASRQAAVDADFSQDWRDVLTRILGEIEERQQAFWE